MRKYLTLSLALALTIMTAACNEGNKPVIDSSNVAIPTDTQKRFNAEKIGNIIAETAAHRGWSVNKAGNGVIKAELHQRNTGELQVAIVIRYSHSSYGITQDTSKVSDARLFNSYSTMLRRDIDKHLSMAAYQ